MVYFILIFFCVFLDQITKHIVYQNIRYNDYIIVINNFFYISHRRNTGAAWSFLSEYEWSRYMFIAITIIVCTFLAYLLVKSKNAFLNISLALIIGGASGNLTDRILKGYVVDFLEFVFGTYHYPTFNVADICVVIGTILLSCYLIFIYENDKERVI